jgi:glutamate-1-semialdehyde 2,1-aminomutase
VIDARPVAPQRLDDLIKRERGRYADTHPASLRAFEAAGDHLLGGVPMTWMRAWPGGFPLYLATAHGARLTDLDGNEFIDFCPATTQADVDAHTEVFGAATGELTPTER